MTLASYNYPIGSPGIPWGAAEKSLWLQQQTIKRSYQDEVVATLEEIKKEHLKTLTVRPYGELVYGDLRYPLFAIETKVWRDELPTILVTGGVHGYETSGVHGALRFVQTRLSDYIDRANFIVTPCISPWGYETINRWNPEAVDPNRSFDRRKGTQETLQFMDYVEGVLAKHQADVLLHIDLHETTDTDNSEFRPALQARDAKEQTEWDIPDGFYCVGDTLKPEPDLQAAIIQAVAQVTHIAEADASGCLIGSKVEQLGVINYPKKELALCAGFTDAPYVSTTEVYPDSYRVNDENCVLAQVAAVEGALDFVLKIEEGS